MTFSTETYRQLINDIKLIYPGREAEAIAELLVEHLGIEKTKMLAGSPGGLNTDQSQWLDNALLRLKNHEPIQYILGTTSFYGLEFIVNAHVLIPRQETEELVDLIIKENSELSESEKILDIGCGSGCIAISLKKAFPQTSVNACDISPKALEVAKSNAKKHHVEINFYEKDVLHIASIPGNCDIIVSNPPYVIESEKEKMQPNVLQYEPSQALFVSNQDPLVFYTAIIELAFRNLNPGGKIYFEINETKGDDVEILMNAVGFNKVRIIQDLNNKDRIATGIKYG